MPRTVQVKAPIYSRLSARAHVGIAFESFVMWLHTGGHILVVFVLEKIGTLIIFFILKIRKKKFQEKNVILTFHIFLCVFVSF